MRDRVVRWAAAVALAVVAGTALVGCGKKDNSPAAAPPAPAARPVIGVTLLTLTNPFFKVMGDDLVSDGAKHGYDVVVVSGDLDPAKQKDQVRDFLVRKVAALVITPCDSKAITTAIVEANQAGVPVFTADVAALTGGTAKVICHTATDNFAGGQAAGRTMVELLHGNGEVAVIDHPEVESAQLRVKGFMEEIAKTPGIKVVDQLPGSGDRQRSFAVAQDLLQKDPHLNAIFSINDPSALGAIAAIEKAGMASQVKVIGFDGTPEARQAVDAGKIYATVMQHPEQIAADTMDAIAKYMAGEDVPSQNLIPVPVYRRLQ